MCECYQIGGRFIAEDPDCPIHGRAAQQLRQGLTEAEAREILIRHALATAQHTGTDWRPSRWMVDAVCEASRTMADRFMEQ